jgi:hypothetical protein
MRAHASDGLRQIKDWLRNANHLTTDVPAFAPSLLRTSSDETDHNGP